MNLERGFTLALGGGGARGYAHIGVARALAARSLRPATIGERDAGLALDAHLGEARADAA